MSTEVAPGVHRLGSALVNYHLVEDGGGLTLVDAGMPRLRGDLERLLGERGLGLDAIDAVVLTHAHPDHVGFAEHVRRAGAPVYVHAGDAEMARTGKAHKREGSLLPYLRRPTAWKLVGAYATGGLPKHLAQVTPFHSDTTELDVPGRLRVVATPGHSPGHCALLLADRGVVFTGDALCGWNPLTGRLGPQVMPDALNWSTERAIASLGALEALDAGTVLFGHGEPWTRGIAAAVARAREAGPS
jgi:glyoxylase-like metal-dependent hydrolase (beta-lactamase superfamily II)